MGIGTAQLDSRLTHGLRLQAIGMKLGIGAKNSIRRKVSAITRRYPGLLGLELEAKQATLGNRKREFLVKVRLILPGYDRIVAKRAEAFHVALAHAFHVAERQLRRRATRSRHKGLEV